jgi:hypothetical protein
MPCYTIRAKGEVGEKTALADVPIALYAPSVPHELAPVVIAKVDR